MEEAVRVLGDGLGGGGGGAGVPGEGEEHGVDVALGRRGGGERLPGHPRAAREVVGDVLGRRRGGRGHGGGGTAAGGRYDDAPREHAAAGLGCVHVAIDSNTTEVDGPRR